MAYSSSPFVDEDAEQGRGQPASTPGPPSIVYICVARGDVILAEHQADRSLDLTQVLPRILAALAPDQELRKSYSYGQFLVNIRVVDGLTFVCFTQSAYSLSLTFQLLSSCSSAFRAAYGSGRDVDGMPPGSLNDSFAPRCFVPKLEEFNAQEMKRSRVQQLTDKVEETKGVMLDNMRNVLDRGEKLEVIKAQTDRFADDAALLHENAVEARVAGKRRLCRRTFWSWCLCCTMLLILLGCIATYIALGIACDDWTVQKCWDKGSVIRNATHTNGLRHDFFAPLPSQPRPHS